MTAVSFDLLINPRIIVGVILCAVSSFWGAENIYVSVVEGMQTYDWPSTVGRITTASQRLGSSIGCPGCQMLVRYYIYEVDGQAYQSPDFDIHGPFVGREGQLERFNRNYANPLTVYYNPDAPNQAVLKRGISFDHTSIVAVLFLVAGLVLIMREVRRTVSMHRRTGGAISIVRGNP